MSKAIYAEDTFVTGNTYGAVIHVCQDGRTTKRIGVSIGVAKDLLKALKLSLKELKKHKKYE